MPGDSVTSITISYRDTDGLTASEADWNAIEHVLKTRGWMSLNRHTTPAISLCEDNEGLAGFFIAQFIPHLGPMWVRPGLRGTDVPLRLVSHMHRMMEGARGFVIVADNPWTAKLCEQLQMKRVEAPVFVLPGAEV